MHAASLLQGDNGDLCRLVGVVLLGSVDRIGFCLLLDSNNAHELKTHSVLLDTTLALC